MFHRPKTPPLPIPQHIALPSRLPTTTADLAPDPSPSYCHHAHLVIFIILVSLLQHFCCHHPAYHAQSSSRLQMQETTDREVFQLPARFKSTQNRPISRTLVLVSKFTRYLQNQSVWFREICRILVHPSLFITIARRSPNNNQQQ